MLQSSDDALRFLAEGETLLGEGWTQVNNLDEIDEDEYEEEEEEIYVTMDLGTVLDAKALQNTSHYQLVGLDTPLPFLKLGNQIFQGQSTPLIGDEVILGMVRNSDNPHEPSHPPLYSTNHRLTFRAITLEPRPPPNLDDPPSTSTSTLTASASHSGVPISAQTTQGIIVRSEAEAGPSTPNQASSSTPSAQHPFFTSSTPTMGVEELRLGGTSTPGSMKGKRGNIKGRPKGSYKSRMIIDKPEDLENFDLSAMKTSQKVELGPNVMQSLGLPSTHGENVTLTKTVLSQVISGYPELGQSSRSGSSYNKGKSWGVDNDGHIAFLPNQELSKKSEGPPGGNDIQMIDHDQPTDTGTTSQADHDQRNQVPSANASSQNQQQQDQVMIDVEDDPPWAEVDQNDVLP